MMQEIWIPEFIICFLLFLHIIRPVVKGLNSVSGFAWTPLVALVILVFLFPAYGFRPELLPLLIFIAVLVLAGIPRQLRDDAVFGGYRKAKVILIIPPLVILAAAAGTAFYFTPEKDTAYSSSGVFTLRAETAAADKGRGKEYLIRVYTDETDSRPAQRPLIVILPPALGSLAAVDQVSSELCSRGFTVLTWQERHSISLTKWLRRVRTSFAKTVSAKTCLWGRAMEDARKEDILFLVSLLRKNPLLEDRPLFHYASRNAVFFAGYDSGGAALILGDASLSDYGTGGDPLSEIRIRGLVAIESSLWSVYREETAEIPDLPPDAGWLDSVRHGLYSRLQGMKPKKITGPGRVPELSFPFLFLVSGRSRNNGCFFPVISETFYSARGPAELVYLDGTIQLDYSDFPSRYPFITALLRGREKAPWNNNDAPARTAGIITNFAASVLEREDGFPPSLKSAALPGGTRIISR